MNMPGPFLMRARVYYEDTDTGGVVYYANYLRFMERARSDWLRSLGMTSVELARTAGVLFAVHRVCVEYHSPARLDDDLTVSAEVLRLGRAGITFHQEVRREQVLLCHGEVKIACLDVTDFRPCPLPQSILSKLPSGSVP